MYYGSSTCSPMKMSASSFLPPRFLLFLTVTCSLIPAFSAQSGKPRLRPLSRLEKAAHDSIPTLTTLNFTEVVSKYELSLISFYDERSVAWQENVQSFAEAARAFESKQRAR